MRADSLPSIFDWMTNQAVLKPAQQRSADKRAAIVAAARAVLGARGFEAATIKEVAQQANIAQSLVHYYFKNKDELLLAVLKETMAHNVAATRALLRSVSPHDLFKRAAGSQVERIETQPEWFRLRFELFALGLHNPALLPGIRDLLASGRDCNAEIADFVVGRPLAQAQAVGAILVACLDGLALQKLSDPSFDVRGAYDLLFQMLAALVPKP